MKDDLNESEENDQNNVNSDLVGESSTVNTGIIIEDNGTEERKNDNEINMNLISERVKFNEKNYKVFYLDNHKYESEESIDGSVSSVTEFKTIDDVQKWVDRKSHYETTLIWFWLLPVTLCVPCAYMNILLVSFIPSYSCSLPTVPSNLSLAVWKNSTLPW